MPFKNLPFTVVALLVILTLGFTLKTTKCTHVSSAVKSSETSDQPDSATGFALVELFTSEGCSSCPPADALAIELLHKKWPNVYLLSFHVDYWDRLGWKDRFSKAEWSDRQRQYADWLGLSGAYTPQIVVNGLEEFVGSDEDRLYRTVKKGLLGPKSSTINLSVSRKGDVLEVTAANAVSGSEQLEIALVQDAAETQVQRGENEGRRLKHQHIVLDLKSVGTSKENLRFSLPELGGAHHYQLIAFQQEKATGRIRAVQGFEVPAS